jgi:predicted nucleotidyltransferase
MINPRSSVKNRILGYFFLNEQSHVYINELARILDADPKNVYRMLVRLEEEGVLTSEFKGKERFFYADKKSPVYKGYRDIFLKTVGVEEILRKKIREIPQVKEAYIFGSYADKRFGAGSDIDVLLVGAHKGLDVEKQLHVIQKHIGREINIVNLTPDDLKKKRASKDQFVNGIFSHKLIKLL